MLTFIVSYRIVGQSRFRTKNLSTIFIADDLSTEGSIFLKMESRLPVQNRKLN